MKLVSSIKPRLKTFLSLGISSLRKFRYHQLELHEQYEEIIRYWLKPSHVVLNAGCGTRPRAPVKGSCLAVVGVDVEGGGNPGVDTFVHADLQKLPFKNKSFDMITCYETVEHLVNPEACFNEFSRICRDGAIAIIVTPNVLHYANFLIMITPYAFHEWFAKTFLGASRYYTESFPTRYRANTPWKLKQMMEKSGFKTIEVRCIDGGPLHLQWFTPLYAVGLVYHRIVNRFKWLSFLRSDMIAIFRR